MKKLITIGALASLVVACSDDGSSKNSATNAANSSNSSANNSPDMGNGSNSSTHGGVNRLSVTLPPANSGLGAVTLAANTPVRLPLTFTLPPDLNIGQVVHVAIDAQRSADLTTITRTDGGTSPDPTASVKFAIVAGSDANAACDAPPAVDVTVTGNADFSEKTAVDNGTGTDALVDTVNGGGDFSVCFEAEASVNVEVTLAAIIEFELDAGCSDAPSDIVGTWAGSYTCSDSCGGEESSVVELNVLQAGETALYFDDGPAFYFGSVCGDRFSFVGGGATYSEWGHFDLGDGTNATKESTWLSNIGDECGGDCTDELTRQ